MAIAVRDTIQNNSASDDDILTSWTGVQENDFLIVMGFVNDTGEEWDNEASWTKILFGFTHGMVAIYYRFAPTSFTSKTFDYGTLAQIGAVGIALSGVDLTNPISSIGPQISDDSTTAPRNLPAVQQANNSWSVVFCACDGVQMHAAPEPSGYTLEERLNTNVGLALATKALSSTVPVEEAPGDWLLAASQEWVTAHLVIVPSGATWGDSGGSIVPRKTLEMIQRA